MCRVPRVRALITLRAASIITTRISYTGVYVRSPGVFGLYGGPEVSPSGVNIYEGRSNALDDSGVLGVNYVLSSSLLTDFRFGTTRYRIIENPLDAGLPLASQAG